MYSIVTANQKGGVGKTTTCEAVGIGLTIAGCKVLSVRDYETDKIRNLVTGEETGTGLPKSNVLYYELEGDAWLCVRPSGTEPKIKFYYGIVGTSLEDAQRKDDDFKVKIDAMVNEML